MAENFQKTSTTGKNRSKPDPVGRARARDPNAESAKIGLEGTALTQQQTTGGVENDAAVSHQSVSPSEIPAIQVRKKPEPKAEHFLLEILTALSIRLQDEFKTNGIQYTIQGKNLDMDELFGVDGLLVSFMSVADERKQNAEKGFSFYLVRNPKAIAEVSPRLEGAPFDFDAARALREAIAQIAGELKVTETERGKTCSVDEVYESFYRACQAGNITTRDESDICFDTASVYARKMLERHSYDNAESIFRQALTIRKEILGEDHAWTCESRHCIEECLLIQGKGEAIPSEPASGSERMLAPTMRICDLKSFQERLKQETDKDNERKLSALKGITELKRLPRIPEQTFLEIDRIGKEQPNFAEVTDLILNSLHAQAISGRAAQLPPLLLVGPPGVGKTRYLKRIAKVLSVPFVDIQLAGASDGFQIAGLSRYWGSAGPGAIANVFVNHDVANPVFLLDEIDKAKSDRKSDALSVIMLLLEKESSRFFKDAFLDLPLDVSHASLIATANDISMLPEPLISRFQCVDIKPLDYDGRCTMVRTTYGELLLQEQLEGFLDREMPPSVLDSLASCEALGGRELKREILQAMQRACREHKIGATAVQSIALKPLHLRLPETRTERSIGFLN